MPPTAIITDTRTIRPAGSHTVYVKQNWLGAWFALPHVYCDWCVFAAAPSIGAASFSWRYGVGLRQGERTFAAVEHLERLKWWVKVEIEPQPDGLADPIVWRGRFEEDARRWEVRSRTTPVHARSPASKR